MTIRTEIAMFGVSIAIMLAYFVLIFLVEVWLAADEGNNSRNVLFNLSHGLLYKAFGFGVSIVFAGWTLPKGLFPLQMSSNGSLGLALLLSFVSLAIYDFFYYWFHRLQHYSRWLWAEHELHHSDEHVNVTTGTRHHYLEQLILPICVTIPMKLMFQLPVVNVAAALLLTDAFVYFIHANARIGLGPLNRLIGNPQVHRIHHSKLAPHIDKNFAAYFPFWDVLFGTYCHPKRGEYPPTGLASNRSVNSLWDAAVMPFQSWRRMLFERKCDESVIVRDGSNDVVLSSWADRTESMHDVG